jgi:hypothetical protein
MNSGIFKSYNNDKGSTLITVTLILLVVTIIGIVATRTADIELRIAAHDKFHKITWWATNAAVQEVTPELIEQAIDMRLTVDDKISEVFGKLAHTSIFTNDFYLNEDPVDSDPEACVLRIPTETNADIALAPAALGQSDIYVRVYGDPQFSPGNALQLPEGYHGRGKSLASGGTMVIYNVRAFGKADSQARIAGQWRHVTR